MVLPLLGVASGCASHPGVTPEHVRIFERGEVAPAPLPDDSERAAGRLAALVLADRPDTAAVLLEAIESEEQARRERGEPPTGLADNSRDLVYAQAGHPVYLAYALEARDDDDLDPMLRHRLDRYVASQPLEVADERLDEDRQTKIAAIFNSVAPALSRFFVGGTLHPIESGRAALASLLSFRSFPTATRRERQALRAYQDFVERNPDSPEVPEVQKRIAHYESKRQRHLHEQALEAAERAAEAGRPDVALQHLERAERLIPHDEDAEELAAEEREDLDELQERELRSQGALALVGRPLDEDRLRDYELLCATTIGSTLREAAAGARNSELRYQAGSFDDELAFVRAFGPLGRGDENDFFAEMEQIAQGDPSRSNMARHAARVVADMERNPYAHLERARSHARNQRLLWLALGNRKDGPLHRELWRPVEWLLDAPGFAVSIATFPLRIPRFGAMRSEFDGPVLHAGEQYVHRFPDGEHADEVHAELVDLYDDRAMWSRALEHERELSRPDPVKIALYTERIADRTLLAARFERRPDVRISIYKMIARDYPGTAAADLAMRDLRALIDDYTPQHIRLSREFLEENPALWGPGALGLSPDLFDGSEHNGELADAGVTLIGRNGIRIDLVDSEPVVEAIPMEDFARFAALLEQVQYQTLVTDEREVPIPDPQRDLFFERARLGLVETADMRPTAGSQAQYLSQGEKYGVRRRQSILPVELVLQGGLEDFGVSAFPRLKPAPPPPGGVLYD